MEAAITWPFIVCVCTLVASLFIWLIYAHRNGKLSLESCKSGSTQETELWRVLAEARYGSIRFLAHYRTTVAVFCWYLLLHAGFTHNFYNYRHFTVWNWIQLTIFYTFSSLIGWFYHLEIDNQLCLNKCFWIKSNFFAQITWTLYQIQCANVLFVDVIVWCLLYPFATEEQKNTVLLTWFSINMHITNFVVIYIDLFINQIPINIHYAAFGEFFVVIYVLFQWIWVQDEDNEFSYPFLDTNTLYHLGFYFGLFAIGIFFFQCAVWCTKYRNYKFPLENMSSVMPNFEKGGSQQKSIEIVSDKEIDTNPT